MWLLHHPRVPVGGIDVGSNTVRFEVARGTRTIYSERTMLGLGESVERFGTIPEEQLARAASVVARYVAEAQRHGAARVEVLVTSPGRQAANGVELLDRIAAAAHVPVQLLSPEDEGRLAVLGAIERAGSRAKRPVAVCDVGGGSAQIAIGTKREGSAGVHSIDIASMRLTARCFATDPPGLPAMSAARGVVDRLLNGVIPPRVHAA